MKLSCNFMEKHVFLIRGHEFTHFFTLKLFFLLKNMFFNILNCILHEITS